MIKFEDYWKAKKKIVLQVMLTTDCNLHCVNCSYGCEYSKPVYITYAQYKHVLYRLNKLLADYTGLHGKIHFNLLGGEPLLHPQLDKILKFTYPRIPFLNFTSCCITTNGIKLLSLKPNTYKLLQHKYAYLSITRYPIKFGYDKLYTFLKANHIAFDIQGKTAYKDWEGAANCIDPVTYETLRFGSIFLNPNKTHERSFADCMHLTSLVCWTIWDNKIFPCASSAGFYIKKQNGEEPYKSYPLVEATKENGFKGDYADIDNIESFDNIISIMKSMSVCKVCYSLGEHTWESHRFKNVRVIK